MKRKEVQKKRNLESVYTEKSIHDRSIRKWEGNMTEEKIEKHKQKN